MDPRDCPVGESTGPSLWSLRCIVMPRAGIEIAEFLILHLIKFNVELDKLIVGITVIDRDVVARSWHTGPQLIEMLRSTRSSQAFWMWAKSFISKAI